MNRIIKFRMWHFHKGWSRNGKPATPGMEHDFWISSSGDVSFPEDGWDLNSKEKSGDFVLMQYTGLKDKNGKEIFEGDVVEYEPLSYYGVPFGKQKNEVKFINGSFVLVPYEDKRWGGYQNLKVIGNICENPDLLKK